MKKKIKGQYKHRGRRDLLGDLQLLREANKAQKVEYELLEEQYNKLKERFRHAGSEVETLEDVPQIPVITAEINPQQYGLYSVVVKRMLEDQSFRDMIQRELITRMVQGLMDGDIVQFIVKENTWDPAMLGTYTYAAKLYVVPWEQLVRKKMTIKYRPLE